MCQTWIGMPIRARKTPDTVSRIWICTGSGENHTMRTQFIKEFVPIQQKEEGELNKLIEQKHNIKIDNCSERHFISPIVITVKKDQTVTLALDSKEINKFIYKNNIKCLTSICCWINLPKSLNQTKQIRRCFQT